MILRARRKPIEEIPPEAICCEEYKQSLTRATGVIVQIDTDIPTPVRCTGCGYIYDSGFYVYGTPMAIFPLIWDIEEAPEERIS